MHKTTLLAGCLAIAAGCASTSTSSTELATESTASPVGDWLDNGRIFRTADLVTLQILGDGRFARIRCLDDGCDRWVPEDGHWKVQKRTIRFYLGAGNVTGANFNPDPKSLLDTWTFSVAHGHLTLSNYGRRLKLDATTDQDVCDQSGGTFTAATHSCDCGSGYIFVAGEGGCVSAPNPSETLCDDTHGSWADDDNILLGTYCECPLDQAWLDGTGCSPQ